MRCNPLVLVLSVFFAALSYADENVPADNVPADNEGLPAEVEELLNEAPDEGDYVEDVRCLPVSRIRSVNALDDRHIIFRLGRSEYYLVQLARRCPGIRWNDWVAYESRMSMSVCRNDSIRGTDRFGARRGDLGPRCLIPGFQRISTEQVDLLRATLKQGK